MLNDTETNDENDWRFTGQDKYLHYVKLKWSKFDSAIRDHDHCEFCFEKFSQNKNDLHEGYCTVDKYYWICEKCYNDFKHMFNWEIV